MQRFVYIQTFGCQMNVYDSERILQVLEPLEYVSTDDPSKADLILLNTCTVREKAEQKVMSALGTYAPLKDHNPDLVLGIAGCVAQQEGERLLKRVPYLDLVFGPDNIAGLPELMTSIQRDGKRVSDTTMHKKKNGYQFIKATPVHSGKPTAMVTVMKGCNKTCAYCIVPRVRGRELSKPADDVVAEVQRLVAAGVKEVMLLGQNVNSYGLDREDNILFPQLLDRVDAVEGLERIRFTTSHPVDCTDDLIDRFDGRLPSLCEYFHLPVQSGSERILEEMRRGYTVEEYVDRAQRLREVCPEIHISTDIIVGFPGETQEDFEKTLALMKRVRFDSVFGFKYSQRQGTTAARLPDDLSGPEKKSRLKRVLELADTLREARLAEYAGTVVDILVEGPSKQSLLKPGTPQLSGRSRSNVVENVPVPNGSFGMGRFVGNVASIEIKRSLSHSLYGEVALVQ
jgi:tRNA-2-methylthio-N6-dimethylallyladenosine synthase